MEVNLNSTALPGRAPDTLPAPGPAISPETLPAPPRPKPLPDLDPDDPFTVPGPKVNPTPKGF